MPWTLKAKLVSILFDSTHNCDSTWQPRRIVAYSWQCSNPAFWHCLPISFLVSTWPCQPNISEMSNIPGYTCCTNESNADSSKCDSRTFVKIFYFEHFWTIQAYNICFHPKSPLQRFRTLTRGVYTAPRAPRSWSFKSHVPCDGWVCGLGIAWRLQILSMKPINDHPVAIRSKQPQEQWAMIENMKLRSNISIYIYSRWLQHHSSNSEHTFNAAH